MDDFVQKALWVVLPVCAATGITLIPGPAAEVQFVAYAVLTLIAMAGLWATNAKRRQAEREAAEKRRDEEREKADQERWDKLNERLDDIDERLDKSAKADKALLRAELVRLHREWVEEKGYITLEAHEYASRVHDAYNAVGGNETGDKLWEDLDDIPIEEHREATE